MEKGFYEQNRNPRTLRQLQKAQLACKCHYDKEKKERKEQKKYVE